jgi:lactoylglutathione lyase
MTSTAERETVIKLRSLLSESQPGDTLPESDDLSRLQEQLEYLIPEVLREIHREWRYESLDGVYLKYGRCISADEAEVYGMCIFITDQRTAPFHARIQIASEADEITWMECRAGRRGPHGMERTPYEGIGRALSGLPDVGEVDWMYKVTFGEHRPVIKPTRLSLLVLKTHEVERLVTFYGLLGLTFDAEQHGKGPVHFAALLGELVLEIYPLDQRQTVDATTRVGFAVSAIADLLPKLEAAGVFIVSPLRQSSWGLRAVVRDPDGRAVELIDPAP